MSFQQWLILLVIFLLIVFRIQQSGGLVKPEEDPELEKVASYFEQSRSDLAEVAQKLLPEPQGALLSGMVLGVKSGLPAKFMQSLRKTSTMHIVVVSGQNLTLLSGFILSLASLLGRRKTVLLSLAIIIFYAILTGLQIPVLRAAIMVLFACLAQLLNKEGQSFWIMLLTGSLMLLYEPNWLLSVSFQLSFLATIGVIVVAPELIKRASFMPDLIKQDLVISFAAQALTFPIIAANFHQASLSGIWVNALVLWTVPIIMISGSAAILVSLFSLGLAQILVLIPGVFLTYFVYIVQFFSNLGGSFYVGQVPILIWVGYYTLLFGLFLWIKQANFQAKNKNQSNQLTNN